MVGLHGHRPTQISRRKPSMENRAANKGTFSFWRSVGNVERADTHKHSSCVPPGAVMQATGVGSGRNSETQLYTRAEHVTRFTRCSPAPSPPVPDHSCPANCHWEAFVAASFAPAPCPFHPVLYLYIPFMLISVAKNTRSRKETSTPFLSP